MCGMHEEAMPTLVRPVGVPSRKAFLGLDLLWHAWFQHDTRKFQLGWTTVMFAKNADMWKEARGL